MSTGAEMQARIKKLEGLVDWYKDQIANSGVLLESARTKRVQLRKAICSYIRTEFTCLLPDHYKPEMGSCKYCNNVELCKAYVKSAE